MVGLRGVVGLRGGRGVAGVAWRGVMGVAGRGCVAGVAGVAWRGVVGVWLHLLHCQVWGDGALGGAAAAGLPCPHPERRGPRSAQPARLHCGDPALPGRFPAGGGPGRSPPEPQAQQSPGG